MPVGKRDIAYEKREIELKSMRLRAPRTQLRRRMSGMRSLA
jgi:hypothetical protein